MTEYESNTLVITKVKGHILSALSDSSSFGRWEILIRPVFYQTDSGNSMPLYNGFSVEGHLSLPVPRPFIRPC